jgi:hypothetical protein
MSSCSRSPTPRCWVGGNGRRGGPCCRRNHFAGLVRRGLAAPRWPRPNFESRGQLVEQGVRASARSVIRDAVPGWPGARRRRSAAPPPTLQRLERSQFRPPSRPPATFFRGLAGRLCRLSCTPRRYRRVDALVGSARSAGWLRRRSSDRPRGASGIGGRLGWKAHPKHRSLLADAVAPRRAPCSATQRDMTGPQRWGRGIETAFLGALGVMPAERTGDGRELVASDRSGSCRLGRKRAQEPVAAGSGLPRPAKPVGAVGRHAGGRCRKGCAPWARATESQGHGNYRRCGQD